MVWGKGLARRLYGLTGVVWSKYLDIDERGRLIVKLKGYKIDIAKLVSEKQLPGAHIRILPIIRYMMDQVYEAFMEAFRKFGYKGAFKPVYPLKSNSTPIVVDTIWRYGIKYSWGFNAGTYPEVKLISKYINEKPRLLVVDGIKDNKFLDLLSKMCDSWEIIVDIESMRDADLLSKYQDLNIGLRVKVTSKSSGLWSHSSGLDSKFGLLINTLDEMVEKHPWVPNRTVLLHVHAGSQITDKNRLEDIIRETIILYNNLVKTGFKNIRYIDFGGGLAYPYIEASNHVFSANYSLNEYAEILVKELVKSAENTPDIVFEGGRYIVAPHRITVTKIIDTRPYSTSDRGETSYPIVEEIKNTENIKELVYVSRKAREVITRLMLKFPINIESRRILEKLLTSINEAITSKAYEIIHRDNDKALEELIKTPNYVLEELVSPTRRFFASFSLFSHLPDTIIADQYFKIIPLQRLNEKPEVLGVISDLTCDSMGEYSSFITFLPNNIEYETEDLFTSLDHKLMFIPGKTLRLKGVPLHIPRKNEDYYIAFLDTGAYQDMLSMNHNLLNGYPEIIIDIINDNLKIIYENLESAENYPL